MAVRASENIEDVHEFWNTEACGTHFIGESSDDWEFYQRFREFRYRTEWHIQELVPFAEADGKSVLEIGLGNGADGVMFALNGAEYTGVDLTEAAVAATRRHFEVMGLTGKFVKGNVEHLEFADESFDMVYSHGVLHHTPRTDIAIGEVHRVLRPGGRAIVMLYHKHSFNYFVRIMIYMRLRVIFRILGAAIRWSEDRRKILEAERVGLRGNEDRKVYDIHYSNFLRRGWSYLKACNFIHHCTDGPECPYAYAFSKKEVRQLFASFHDIETKVAHFPIRKYHSWRWVPLAFERYLASLVGWYLFIYATK